jgi:hypothetical protein
MGRPKGRTDSTPRTRRRKNEITAAPPERLTQRERRIKRQLKDIAKDLVYNDWYIKIGLAVSGIQLFVTFVYVTKSPWATGLSIVSALGKAAFVEAGVWLINRTISHARAIRVHAAWQGVLWSVLFILMFISVRANVRYEWEKRAEVKYPKGHCVAYDADEPTVCVKYDKINVNETNVSEFLSAGEQSEAWQRGGLIPLLVFASIIIGRVMLSAKDGFEKEEVSKLKKVERDTVYRAKKKRAIAERVQTAEALGLTAGEG